MACTYEDFLPTGPRCLDVLVLVALNLRCSNYFYCEINFGGPTDNNIITLLLFTANAKSVSYLIVADGNPWVWVLGEGDDKPDSFEIFRSKWTGSLVNDL